MPSGGAKRAVLYDLYKRSSPSRPNADGLSATCDIQNGTRPPPVVVFLYVEGVGVDTRAEMILGHVADCATTGTYIDDRYKHADKLADVFKNIPIALQVVAPDTTYDQTFVDNGTAAGMGVIMTKEVVNSPANSFTPHPLATVAKQVEAKTDM